MHTVLDVHQTKCKKRIKDEARKERKCEIKDEVTRDLTAETCRKRIGSNMLICQLIFQFIARIIFFRILTHVLPNRKILSIAQRV